MCRVTPHICNTRIEWHQMTDTPHTTCDDVDVVADTCICTSHVTPCICGTPYECHYTCETPHMTQDDVDVVTATFMSHMWRSPVTTYLWPMSRTGRFRVAATIMSRIWMSHVTPYVWHITYYTQDDVDVVAATVGPGMEICLRVGAASGRRLALQHGKPFVGVHHLEVFTWMCMCIEVHVYAHTYTHTRTHTNSRTHKCTCTHTRTDAHSRVYSRTACAGHDKLSVNVYLNIFIYVYLYIYIYTYI